MAADPNTKQRVLTTWRRGSRRQKLDAEWIFHIPRLRYSGLDFGAELLSFQSVGLHAKSTVFFADMDAKGLQVFLAKARWCYQRGCKRVQSLEDFRHENLIEPNGETATLAFVVCAALRAPNSGAANSNFRRLVAAVRERLEA